jgi:hypothetical protein
MLNQAKGADVRPAVHIPERKLWQDEILNTLSLGCWGCPERGICGGLAVQAGLTSCLDLCCGNPGKCDKPCRNNPDYALRVREVGTFALENVPRAMVLPAPRMPLVLPVLFHGGRREEPLGRAPVALPLYTMFNRRSGALRFGSHEALCAEFGLLPGTPVVLTGTDQDPPLERWWEYQSRRREIVRGLRAIGAVLSTTPNFSLFVDVPRHVDLHAIKRIALVHCEFLDAGLPCALHVNGRTEADFTRWAAYIRARPEITHIAYEFTTGTGRAARRAFHIDGLLDIATSAGRPLDLIVRGGIEALPRLTAVFNQVSVLETWSFMKTMKRQRAEPRTDGNLLWRRAPTALGAPLDTLFAANRAEVSRWIEGRAAGPAMPAKAVAVGE